jgi:hypothetical protein
MILNLFTVVRLKIKKIFLFYNNNHYDYIKSLPAFFNEKKFCFICFQPYQNGFFTNVSKNVNYVKVKLVKKRSLKNRCLNDLCL